MRERERIMMMMEEILSETQLGRTGKGLGVEMWTWKGRLKGRKGVNERC